jgi:hypothetical protein
MTKHITRKCSGKRKHNCRKSNSCSWNKKKSRCLRKKGTKHRKSSKGSKHRKSSKGSKQRKSSKGSKHRKFKMNEEDERRMNDARDRNRLRRLIRQFRDRRAAQAFPGFGAGFPVIGGPALPRPPSWHGLSRRLRSEQRQQHRYEFIRDLLLNTGIMHDDYMYSRRPGHPPPLMRTTDHAWMRITLREMILRHGMELLNYFEQMNQMNLNRYINSLTPEEREFIREYLQSLRDGHRIGHRHLEDSEKARISQLINMFDRNKPLKSAASVYKHGEGGV